MKRLIALLLALIFLMISALTSSTGESSPATQTDLDPIPTPIIITKELKGEIWHVRCDTMDNTNFTAGGGRWMADISNWENKTSKEGHRSNHCGDANNWVLFVDADGKANSLYQLKSGSTGGTLPSVVYRAPADLASIPEHQLIYDPTVPNDTMTARLINEVFRPENAMPFNEIQLVSGKRLFWTSQNGNQVWHHTGVLSGPERPRFTIVVNGVAYALGVGESVEIDIIEEGLLEIEEIATANYKLQAVKDYGEGNITIINEIDHPDKPTPKPPRPVVTPTPSPTSTEETPAPTPTETATPTPTSTPTPSPTPTPSVTPSPTPTFTPTPSPTPTVTPTISPSPTSTQTISPTPTVTPSPTPTTTVTVTPSPTSTPTATPTSTPSPTPIPTSVPTSTVIPTPTLTPNPTPIITLEPSAKPTPTITPIVTVAPTESPTPKPTLAPTFVPVTIYEYGVPLGIPGLANQVGDCYE